MSRPLDRNAELPELGDVDREAGEFWIKNPFRIPSSGNNLSAYERNRLFLNVEGRAFIDASFASRADIDSDSRSVVVADFDQVIAEPGLMPTLTVGTAHLWRGYANFKLKNYRQAIRDFDDHINQLTEQLSVLIIEEYELGEEFTKNEEFYSLQQEIENLSSELQALEAELLAEINSGVSTDLEFLQVTCGDEIIPYQWEYSLIGVTL